MAMNQVQFQAGLSMAQFIERYGTEAKNGQGQVYLRSIRIRYADLRTTRPTVVKWTPKQAAICA